MAYRSKKPGRKPATPSVSFVVEQTMVIASKFLYHPVIFGLAASSRGFLRPFGTSAVIVPSLVSKARFSTATGCAAAITEVLVKARAIKEIRENLIFGTL
jgi:hypothetical protein